MRGQPPPGTSPSSPEASHLHLLSPGVQPVNGEGGSTPGEVVRSAPGVIASTHRPLAGAPSVIAPSIMASPSAASLQPSPRPGVSQSLEARQPLPLPQPSLSTSLAALTSPTASSADLALSLTVGRTREGWRSSSVVRQSSWRCTNCSTIVAQSVMACSTCGTTYAELSGQASEAELRAISDDCALTHYGRSLAYTSNVSPLVAEGVGALPGSAEYCAAVQARTVSMMQGRPQEFRVEPKLPKGANLFDGWLAFASV